MQTDLVIELFAALGRVVVQTRRVLAWAIAHDEQRLPPGEQDYLDGTLTHLSQVREGFVVTLRTEKVHSDSELYDLVQHILVDWSWLEELGLSWQRGEQRLEVPTAQVLAFAHASVALGYLPQLPPQQITFPHTQATASYADIPVPHSPGEWLERIEELESVIEQIGARPPARMARDKLRRTYGYFEASAWLVSQHQARWGGRH
jgi:hypothetical protein